MLLCLDGRWEEDGVAGKGAAVDGEWQGQRPAAGRPSASVVCPAAMNGSWELGASTTRGCGRRPPGRWPRLHMDGESYMDGSKELAAGRLASAAHGWSLEPYMDGSKERRPHVCGCGGESRGVTTGEWAETKAVDGEWVETKP